jgi:hypothetical protein
MVLFSGAKHLREGGAARVCHNVNIGMVGINVPIPVPMAFHSFGGWKRSQFGDHHMHGPRGRALLHQAEGRHVPLADRHPRRSRVQDANHGVSRRYARSRAQSRPGV